MRRLCEPGGLRPAELEVVAALVSSRRKLDRGARLLHAGDPCVALFAIRYGSVKSTARMADGREQVTGFHFAGDLLGLEGLAVATHARELVALEDTELCVVRRGDLDALLGRLPRLHAELHALMGREVVRAQGTALALGSLAADERVAAFLAGLSRRLRELGRDGTALVLQMTRAEIGSFLGLQLETVSRIFSRLHGEGILEVKRQVVTIRDGERLERLAARGVPLL